MNFKDLSPLEFDDSLIININKLLTTINLKIPNFSLNYLKPRQRPSKSAKAILFFSNRDEEKKTWTIWNFTENTTATKEDVK